MTKVQNSKFELILLAGISLIGGFCIDFHYWSLMPDFDIGFNEAFTALKCWILILILWGIELIILIALRKQINNPRNIRLTSVAVLMIYGLIVWGLCYYQYIVKATQEWNEMMNGNVG